MNVSLNWLTDYVDIAIPATELATLLTHIGMEVEPAADEAQTKGNVGELKIDAPRGPEWAYGRPRLHSAPRHGSTPPFEPHTATEPHPFPH